MLKVDHLVIGAGAVGLAIARELSMLNKTTFLIEKLNNFGLETSSRNSQVIHCGVYYPPDSLKTSLCIKGRIKLYEFLEKYKITFRKTGKFIVSTQQNSDVQLEMLLEKGRNLNINLEFLTNRQVVQQEPNLKFTKVLYSPETGIFDSYGFMEALEGLFIDQGGQVFYRTEVVNIEKSKNGILVYLRDNTVIQADWVINSTGLDSNVLSKDKRKLYYVKGHYVKYNGKSLVSRLVYPLPDKDLKSLGIHCTLDVAGTLKFGPDVLYLKEKDYSLPTGEEEIQILDKFHKEISTYLKGVDKCKLSLDYAGIRPKLSGENEGFKDFVIERDDSCGFINLLGIESPGLTSSLAIAEHVVDMINSR